MYIKNKTYFPYDTASSFITTYAPQYYHEYFDLPGVFVKSCPNKIMSIQGETGVMDALIYLHPGNGLDFKALMNIENQSYIVNDDKLEKMIFYRNNAAAAYGLPLIPVIITDYETYKSSKKFQWYGFEKFKPIYIFMTLEEISQIINTLKYKLESKEDFSRRDILNILIIPIFCPKDKGREFTKELIVIYKQIDVEDNLLNSFCIFSLGIMVNNYLSPDEQDKFYEVLNMDNETRFYEEIADSRLVAERDQAVLERDSAVFERDSAILERDEAIKNFHSLVNKLINENLLNDNGMEYVGGFLGK